MKLIPLLIFLGSFTQLSAQFTLDMDAGYAHPIFNEGQSSVMVPPILGSNVPTTQRAEIQAVAEGFLALSLEYAPPENIFAWELRLQYLKRGYNIRIFDQTFGGLSFPFVRTRGHYLDIMPSMIYHFSPQFSLRAGGYLSPLIGKSGTYFITDDNQRLNQIDIGLNLGATLSSGRFHLRLDYQRSSRKLDYPIYDINISTAAFYDGSPISLLRVGLGYTLMQPDRGLVPYHEK